jgi:hypothetical protein
MKHLLFLIALLVSITSYSQKGKDKEPPTVNNFIAIVSGDDLFVDADVSDETMMYGVFYFVEPTGNTDWRPQRNVGKSIMGTAKHNATGPYQSFDWSHYFDISNLLPGTYTLRIDAWDAAKNLERQEIEFFVP